jgi:hypothetical protein
VTAEGQAAKVKSRLKEGRGSKFQLRERQREGDTKGK